MSFVLDASATIAWAFGDELSMIARPALYRVQEDFACASVLWQFEIASALRKASLDGRLSRSSIDGFLADLSTLDIHLESEAPPIRNLLNLAEQFDLSIYDAAYLELAQRTSLPLATLDRNLGRAAQHAGVVLLLAS
jgi:predicted nucleic acid-binding protein